MVKIEVVDGWRPLEARAPKNTKTNHRRHEFIARRATIPVPIAETSRIPNEMLSKAARLRYIQCISRQLRHCSVCGIEAELR